MHNLITDPVITLRLAHETIGASLPRTLALLLEDAVIDFPALRPHQAPAWHAFLVQLAFLATEDAEVPTDPDGWAAALRGLTPDWPQDEPWCLVAPADTPAFLQSAAPGGDLARYADRIATPDLLDPRDTAKNHDLKGTRMRAATPEDWLFALMTLQTTAGYSGRTHYGIMRMQNAWSSRPFLGIQPPGSFGARFHRDLAVLSQRKNDLYAQTPAFGRRIRLLWLEPWDGEQAHGFEDLHPLAIEICRRVRLRADAEGVIEVCRTGTAAARLAVDKLRGRTGDPWTPIETDKEGPRAISVGADGFGWRRMKELLLSDGRPLLARTALEDGDSVEIVAAGLARTAREKGRTEGFHVRRVSVTNRFAVRALADDVEERQRLAKLAEEFATHVMMAARSCLFPALCCLYRRGKPLSPEEERERWSRFRRDPRRELVRSWMQRFDRLIDQTFFERLWPGAESEEAARQALDAWDARLHAAAFQVFDLAAEAAPRTDQRRIFAAVRARDLLSARCASTFHFRPRRPSRRQRMPNDPSQQQTPRPPNPPLRLLYALVNGLRDRTLTMGDAAALRRLDPAQPDRRHILPLIRLLAGAEIDDRPDTWQRLALIANSVALARGLHDENRPTGAALHALGVSEQRLMALLAADFATLTDLLPRLARRAAAAAERMDWRPLARLAWSVDRDDDEADKQRRCIASTYPRTRKEGATGRLIAA